MALSDFFAEQKRYRPNPAAVRREAKWIEQASRYKSTRRKVKDGHRIKVDPHLAEKTAKAIAKTCPIIAQPFNDNKGPLALKAFKEWPVETGLSKSLIALDYSNLPQGRGIKGTIKCTAPYAYFIRERTGTGKKRLRGMAGKKKDVGKHDDNRSRWLAIAQAPARGRDQRIWAAATLKAARSVSVVTYAAVQVIYERIKGKPNHVDAWFVGLELVKKGGDPRQVELMINKAVSPKRRTKRRGKLVAKDLLFDPGEKVAEAILKEIQQNIVREFSL